MRPEIEQDICGDGDGTSGIRPLCPSFPMFIEEGFVQRT